MVLLPISPAWPAAVGLLVSSLKLCVPVLVPLLPRKVRCRQVQVPVLSSHLGTAEEGVRPAPAPALLSDKFLVGTMRGVNAAVQRLCAALGAQGCPWVSISVHLSPQPG